MISRVTMVQEGVATRIRHTPALFLVGLVLIANLAARDVQGTDLRSPRVAGAERARRVGSRLSGLTGPQPPHLPAAGPAQAFSNRA